jgi:hypothetical protein
MTWIACADSRTWTFSVTASLSLVVFVSGLWAHHRARRLKRT